MVDFSSVAFDFSYFKEFVAAIVGVPTFAYGWYRFGRRKGNADDKAAIAELRANLLEAQNGLAKFQERHEKLDSIVSDSRDFWLRDPDLSLVAERQVAMRTSMPIICVVNFKGGVGKTTICANLAAHFAEQGKRVLLIDCDYQGSLSDTVLAHARMDRFSANSHLLLEPGHDDNQLRLAAERLSSVNSNLWIYPAFYDYSRAEVKMMFRWLIGSDSEIRFNMSSYLQSRAFKSSSETKFDLVMIDAPPRLLTGSVNALAAATHVLVPSILDGQSHLATLNTLAAIRQFQIKLNPTQRLLGVVPSMVTNSVGYTDDEQEYIDELERNIPDLYGAPVPVLKNRPILRKAVLAKAGGSEILVASDANNQATRQARDMFANLADYISANVQWRREDGSSGAQGVLPGQRQRVAS